jgi:hypothetical protein
MLQQVFVVINITIEMMKTPINKLKQIRVYSEIRGLQMTLYYRTIHAQCRFERD